MKETQGDNTILLLAGGAILLWLLLRKKAPTMTIAPVTQPATATSSLMSLPFSTVISQVLGKEQITPSPASVLSASQLSSFSTTGLLTSAAPSCDQCCCNCSIGSVCKDSISGVNKRIGIVC